MSVIQNNRSNKGANYFLLSKLPNSWVSLVLDMIYASALMTLYNTGPMDMAQPQVTQALSECPVCLQKQGEINSAVRS